MDRVSFGLHWADAPRSKRPRRNNSPAVRRCQDLQLASELSHASTQLTSVPWRVPPRTRQHQALLTLASPETPRSDLPLRPTKEPGQLISAHSRQETNLAPCRK